MAVQPHLLPVPKGMSHISRRLGFRKGESAEGATDSTLLEKTLESPHDVVVALLHRAPSCDR